MRTLLRWNGEAGQHAIGRVGQVGDGIHDEARRHIIAWLQRGDDPALGARCEAAFSAPTAARLYLCLTARLVFLGHWKETIALSGPAATRARRAGALRMESLAHRFRAHARSASRAAWMTP